VIETRPLFRLRAQVAPPQITPAGPLGERRFIPVTGGTFAGERLSGTLLGGGADCQLVRADGVAELDVRVTLRCDDGAIILMKGLGMRHGPPEVMARLARGEAVARDEYFFRTLVRFTTGAPQWAHLNKVMAIACGQREASWVRLDLYRLT